MHSRWIGAGVAALAAVTGCKPPPESRYQPDAAAVASGKRLIEETGCGACHEIPGIAWPRGRLGPSLMGFDDVGLIGGALPAKPGALAAFIRNAPAARPGSTMPPMPLTELQAADVAAYLYGAGGD